MGVRETVMIAASQLNSANGKLASVLTFKTRLPWTTWSYRTAILGYKGEETKGWFQEWDDEDAARAGHQDVCRKIFTDQGVTLQ